MADLASCHQTKQSPCRLRGRRDRSRKALVIESVAGGIFTPAAIPILNRDQPRHRLAHRRVLMVDARSIERAERRPGAVDVIHAPSAVPGSLVELGPAQI